MSIIKKQTLWGSIYSYIGVLLGFIISGFLMPEYLSTEQNGLIKLFTSYSLIFIQIAGMGFPNAITRNFSFFRDEKNKHNGFSFILILVLIIGLLLTLILFFIVKPVIIQDSQEKSRMFTEYVDYLIPFIVFNFIFVMMDSYLKVLYRSLPGIFIKEVLLRIFVISSILVYFTGLIGFHEFIILYTTVNCIPGIITLIVTIRTGQLTLKPDFIFLTAEQRKSLISVSLFGFLFGFSGILIAHIDTIMVNSLEGIDAAGIYGITYFFGTIIIIPARVLRKVASVVIAEAWKRNDLEQVKTIFTKASINQFLIGGLIFIGIWANIENVFDIIPEEYRPGKYVIFFIGLMNLVEMFSGVSGTLIITSNKYKYTAYLNVFLVILVLISNFIFIKVYGLVGAALASFVSVSIFNIVRFIVIYKTFKIHPFQSKHILTLGILAISYFSSTLINEFDNFILDIIIRSAYISIVYLSLSYILKVSTDANSLINKYLETAINYLKKK